jgi:hypothetical protein
LIPFSLKEHALGRPIVAILGLALALSSLAEQTKVIYGNDDRKDFYQVDANTARLADATAILVLPQELIVSGNALRLNTVPFGTSLALCPEEPYYTQPTVGHCSAFLIAPQIVLTAGHCMSAESSCQSGRFVFGYAMTSATVPNIWEVAPSEVYSCSKILHTVAGNDDDFAVVQLDRPVTHHLPLLYRTAGSPNVGESLMVMGYPEGLPVKIAGGARIRQITPSFLQANLDTFGGNSGSAVFSADTGLVEGILVRGDNDFVLQNGCYVSNQCPDTGCRGEDVTLMSRVLPYLPH